MFQNQNPRVYSYSKDVTRILRGSPKKVDIDAMLYQEAKKSVMTGANNHMDYYSINTEKKAVPEKPQKSSSKSPEPTFKSVHRTPESKETQFVIAKLTGPKYNEREKKALKELRTKEGKLYLLSDLYQEFTREVEKQSEAEIAYQYTKKNRVEEEDNMKLVEDLDRWERSRMQKAIQNLKVDPKKPSVLPQTTKSAATPGNIHSGLIQRTPSLKSINESHGNYSIKESNKPFTKETESDLKESIKFPGEDDSKEKSIEKVDVDQGNESIQELTQEILEMSGSQVENPTNFELLGDLHGMTPKQTAEYYETVHNKQERRIYNQIRQLESAIRQEDEFIRKMAREKDGIDNQVKQVSKQLKTLDLQEQSQSFGGRIRPKYLKQSSQPKIAGTGASLEMLDEDPLLTKRMELNQESQVLEKKIEENTDACVAAENRQKKYREEIQQLHYSRKALFRKILMQGLDTREDGLMWVLQKLQEIGEDVTILDFADFLDARTRRFMLDKARALRELNEVRSLERATIDVFKVSRENLFEQNAQFRSLFRNSIKHLNINGDLQTLEVDASKSSLSNSPEIKSSSLKSAFRLPEVSVRDEISASNRKGSVLTMATPRGASSVTSGGHTEDRYTRKTENEEIYIKTKDLIKNSYKSGDEIRERSQGKKLSQFKRERESTDSVDALCEHVKLYQDKNVLNNYASRKEFLLKMQALTTEAQQRQDKLNRETELEIVRIISDYQNSPSDKQVNLETYLMSVVGYNEAIRFIKKYGLADKRFG